MRRVVLELPEQEIKKLGDYTAELSREVESLEVMHHLRHGREGSAIICKIRPKATTKDMSDLGFRFKKFEVLSEEKDGLIVYLEAETAPLSPEGSNPPKVLLNFPFEVRGGHRLVTFIGDAAELKKLFQWLEDRGVQFDILSNSDARFSPDSVLNSLTEKQRNILTSAYANGYYSTPRKVTLDALARAQNLNKSTLAEHLLKAENRLISQILTGELREQSRPRRRD